MTMTKTNAQAATTAKTPKVTAANKDCILQSSGATDGQNHFVRSVGGESLTFPTEQWTGEIRKLSAIGASFATLHAALAKMPKADKPKAQMARGTDSHSAPHSAKAVADQRGKAKQANKADAATQKPKAAKAPASADKQAKLAALDARKIVDVVPNPKREGTESHVRFAKYKKGMTVAQALSAGLTRGDIDWDSKRSFIKFA
jgi:hypothetical protein